MCQRRSVRKVGLARGQNVAKTKHIFERTARPAGQQSVLDISVHCSLCFYSDGNEEMSLEICFRYQIFIFPCAQLEKPFWILIKPPLYYILFHNSIDKRTKKYLNFKTGQFAQVQTFSFCVKKRIGKPHFFIDGQSDILQPGKDVEFV